METLKKLTGRLLWITLLATGCAPDGGFSKINNENSSAMGSTIDDIQEPDQEVPGTVDSEDDAAAEIPVSDPRGDSGIKITPRWEAAVSDGSRWTTHVMTQIDVLGEDLIDVIPADASLFCPNYSNLSKYDRKQYWTYMISSMVRFESNFKTNTQYTEGFNDSNGNPVVSRGLLQISIESGNAYGCAFKTSADLHDPLQNLSCGIRILNRWLGRDGRVGGKISNQWRGGARYWSVLREGDKESYKSILKWSQALPICK